MSKGLHKSKIDYVRDSGDLINRPGYVLNIITGCKHGCEWCYARRMVERGRLQGHPSYPYGFKPTFHPERIRAIGGKPKLIFLNDMGDVGGEWKWRIINTETKEYPRDAPMAPGRVADEMREFALLNPQHILLLLTKNPSWYRFAEWPDNVYCGFSATNNEELDTRCEKLINAAGNERKQVWISMEPWLDADAPIIDWFYPWLIIGGLSGPNAKPVSHETRIWLLNKNIQARRFTKANALANWERKMIERFPREYPEAWKVKI